MFSTLTSRGARCGPEDFVHDVHHGAGLEALIRFERAALFVAVKAHEAELGLDQPSCTSGGTRTPMPSRSIRSVLLSIATAALLAQ